VTVIVVSALCTRDCLIMWFLFGETLKRFGGSFGVYTGGDRVLVNADSFEIWFSILLFGN
jgi:hypothetical protein